MKGVKTLGNQSKGTKSSLASFIYTLQGHILYCGCVNTLLELWHTISPHLSSPLLSSPLVYWFPPVSYIIDDLNHLRQCSTYWKPQRIHSNMHTVHTEHQTHG